MKNYDLQRRIGNYTIWKTLFILNASFFLICLYNCWWTAWAGVRAFWFWTFAFDSCTLSSSGSLKLRLSWIHTSEKYRWLNFGDSGKSTSLLTKKENGKSKRRKMGPVSPHPRAPGCHTAAAADQPELRVLPHLSWLAKELSLHPALWCRCHPELGRQELCPASTHLEVYASVLLLCPSCIIFPSIRSLLNWDPANNRVSSGLTWGKLIWGHYRGGLGWGRA